MGGGNSKRDPPTVMVEHFNKERMLGIGGFGKVHAVVKKVGHDKDKWYAMKTLDKKALRKSNLLAEIKNEFGLLKDLNFIFTCNLFYCFQDDASVYFVIDIALGGDLRYHLNKASHPRV
jgi:serine/threonine kinase 32